MDIKKFREWCCETVSVCPDFESSVKVSPLLFGNNLEHTRASVYGGISAQMLRNRKFAGMPSCYTGCPKEWYQIGEKTNIVFVESGSAIFGESLFEESMFYTRHADNHRMRRPHERNVVMVAGYEEDLECGIGQADVAVIKNTYYECRIAAKVYHPMVISIALTDRDGKVYNQKELEFDNTEFDTKKVILYAPETDRNAHLTITFVGVSAIYIGAVSLMPEHNFHGMRPDVVALLREMGIKLLRWPGGNFAGEYNWKDGLLPADMRAPLGSYLGADTQPHSMGYDFNEINTDDFVALCREIGAEPFITINLTWNSSEECAQWVEYCNGGAETKYGRLRMERGYKEAYDVKFWSLGNEVGYVHMEGESTAQGYGRLGIEFGKKMLEVSPDLQICSSGPYPDETWVKEAAKPLSEIASLVSLHYYVKQPLFIDPEKYEEEYSECISRVHSKSRELVRRFRRELNDDRLRISFDEWNIWYSWYRPKSVTDGIFTASMLHMLIGEAEPCGMDMACHFEAINEGAIRVEWNRAFLTPGGKMFAVMKHHIDGKLCFVSEDAIATEKENVLTITLINRSYDKDKKFELPGYGTVITSDLYEGQSILPYSDFERKNMSLTESEEGYEVSLPKHSVMLIQMKR